MHYRHRNKSLSRYQSAHAPVPHHGFSAILKNEKDWAEHHGKILLILFVLGVAAFGSLIYHKASNTLAYVVPEDVGLESPETVTVPRPLSSVSTYPN